MTTGHDILLAIRRFWWVILLCAGVAVVVGYIVTPEPLYSTEFRATVLIPGDTEDPGSSERPELMVLDDLGPFTSSWAFAELVAPQVGEDVSTEDIYGLLSGSRYSRIATVNVAGNEPGFVLSVAEAAATVFPEAVNAYLVADGSDAATVQIIDPPREPARDESARWLRIGAIALLVTGGVFVLAVLATPASAPSSLGSLGE